MLDIESISAGGILMEYNPEQVLTAWKAFISQSIIMEDKVRPEIARSWQRCRAVGLDPWSVDFPKPFEELLLNKKKEYQEFLKTATPVLQYLMVLFNGNISLSDRDGFIFELLTPLDYYPRTLGTFLTEDKVGNGNVPIALHDGKPIRVDGYEHYRAISQNYSGVSAPIMNNSGTILGTININSPFDILPASALKSCIEAAEIICRFLNTKKDNLRLFSTANLFKNLVDLNENGVIILDQEGMILTANTIGEQFVNNYQEKPYASQSLSEYLTNKNPLPSLLECNPNFLNKQMVEFKLLKGRKGLTAYLLRKRRILLPNGLVHLVLVFETAQKVDKNSTSLNLRKNTPAVDYIGQSAAWKIIDTMVHKIAKHKANVLLLGETGTGKEVVARAIHRLSGRTGRFVAINCGSIPRDLLASELFGYEGGSFTGARATGSIGKFEWANGGTLFLDEIGEMPVDMQVSLLRALQEQTITKIGSNKPQEFDAHIIAATNKDMQKLIEEGHFRCDLYYRLSVIEIKLPLLKDRQEDIPLLADFFNRELSKELNVNYAPLSDELISALTQYNWPGNVRELKNIIEKLLILSDDKPITIDILPSHIRHHFINMPSQESRQIEEKKKDINQTEHQKKKGSNEKEIICSLLEEYRGNISRVAREMGISRNTLYRRIENLDIKMKFFGSK